MADLLTGRGFRDIKINRPRRMVLDPLAEVGIGMLVAVVIGRRKLVVHILRDGEWRDCQEQQHEHGTQAEGAGPQQTCRSHIAAH